MKKFLSVLMVVALLVVFGVFAIGSSESETEDQGKGTASQTENESNLGDYKVEIMECRLSKDFEGKPVVIVKYNFTNNSEDSTAFYTAFDDSVYQDGVGLNESYVLDDSAQYDEGNQTKDIKSGASIEVEAAYELNDTETDIDVEVEELFSFDDKKITKTFSIKQ